MAVAIEVGSEWELDDGSKWFVDAFEVDGEGKKWVTFHEDGKQKSYRWGLDAFLDRYHKTEN